MLTSLSTTTIAVVLVMHILLISAAAHSIFMQFYCSIGFLPWYKVPNSEQLTEKLGAAIPNSTLSSEMTPKQTKAFLMSLWRRSMR